MALLKGKISRKLIRIVAAICAFSACLTTIGITLARYVSESNADGNATVALFSPSWVSDNIDISGIKKPGDSVEKDFEIRNYTEDNHLSEVCVRYKIVLKTTGNLPLHFALLDKSTLQLQSWDCAGNSGECAYEYASSFVFAPATKQSHGYKLLVEWDKWDNAQNGAQFAGAVDAVCIEVEWTQED